LLFLVVHKSRRTSVSLTWFDNKHINEYYYVAMTLIKW